MSNGLAPTKTQAALGDGPCELRPAFSLSLYFSSF